MCVVLYLAIVNVVLSELNQLIPGKLFGRFHLHLTRAMFDNNNNGDLSTLYT